MNKIMGELINEMKVKKIYVTGRSESIGWLKQIGI